MTLCDLGCVLWKIPRWNSGPCDVYRFHRIPRLDRSLKRLREYSGWNFGESFKERLWSHVLRNPRAEYFKERTPSSDMTWQFSAASLWLTHVLIYVHTELEAMPFRSFLWWRLESGHGSGTRRRSFEPWACEPAHPRGCTSFCGSSTSGSCLCSPSGINGQINTQ